MAIGECSAYRSLQSDSRSSVQLWRPFGADRLSLRGPKANSSLWLRAIDDSTVNIVLCVIIIIIIIILYQRICADLAFFSLWRLSLVPVETSSCRSKWSSGLCRYASRNTERRCWRWRLPPEGSARPAETSTSIRRRCSTNANRPTAYRNRTFYRALVTNKCMRWSDVIELSIKPRRHVGGIPNLSKKWNRVRKSESSNAKVIRRPCTYMS